MKYPKENPKSEIRNPRPNPKPEGRNPKEGRSPKSESENSLERALTHCDFWTWGAVSEGYPTGASCISEALVLRENDNSNSQLRALEDRTALFGEAIIEFAKKVPKTAINDRLISQLVGAGTSVGANYCEADDSVSGKEFKLKIGTCRKESKETMFFLRMIAKSEPSLAAEARKLWREAKELNLIFGAIWRK